jgi:hypothetical protein
MPWDIFICHADEDKDKCVLPLKRALAQAGLSVWLDADVLATGDSVRRAIESGLSKSRYGVVILSPRFFGKEWPNKELDALFEREREGKKVILPVWFEVDKEEVERRALLLSGRRAAKWSDGIDAVVRGIVQAVEGTDGVELSSATAPLTPSRKTPPGSMVMIARQESGPIFLQSLRVSSADSISMVVDPEGDLGAGYLRELQAAKDNHVGYAFDLDAGLAVMKSISEEREGGAARWHLSLDRLVDNDYGAGVLEMGFGQFTVDQLAELRARRILLGELAPKVKFESAVELNSQTLELFIRGINAPVKVLGSPFPRFFQDLRNEPELFLEVSRLFGCYLLRVTGTVAFIRKLDLSLSSPTELKVEFEGQRARKYTNVPPTTIAVSGRCALPT